MVAPSQAAMRRSLRGWDALPHVAGDCLGRHEPPDRDREWAAQDHAVPVANSTTGSDPKPMMPNRSIESVSSTRVAGSRYATKTAHVRTSLVNLSPAAKSRLT